MEINYNVEIPDYKTMMYASARSKPDAIAMRRFLKDDNLRNIELEYKDTYEAQKRIPVLQDISKNEAGRKIYFSRRKNIIYASKDVNITVERVRSN